MISEEGWIWLLGAVTVVALVGWVWNLLRQAARRRARRAYYARAAHETRPQALNTGPAPLAGSMTPDQAAAIRAHAERSAQNDWARGRATRINPYDHGTPEYVLWYATYQLRMGDLAEEAEAEAEKERKDDPR